MHPAGLAAFAVAVTVVRAALVEAPLAAQAPERPAAPAAAERATSQPAAATERLIVLNKGDATVSFLDPATGKVTAITDVGVGPHEVAISPDGKQAVVCNYGDQQPGSTLSVLDVATGKTLRTIALHKPAEGEAAPRQYLRPHGIQFLPGGERLVITAEQDRRLLVVSVASGKIEAAIPTGAQVSHMVALGRGAKRAFVANIGSGSVSVVDLERGELVKEVKTGAGAEGIAVHPTRPEVWVTNRSADTVTVLGSEDLEIQAQIECASFPIRVAFTPDGKRALVSNARSGDVAVIDVATRKIERQVAMRETPDAPSPMPVGILVDPKGRFAYVANMQGGAIAVLDLETWQVTRRLQAGAGPDGMGYSVRGG